MKYFKSLIILLLAAVLVSCSNNNANDDGTKDPISGEEVPSGDKPSEDNPQEDKPSEVDMSFGDSERYLNLSSLSENGQKVMILSSSLLKTLGGIVNNSSVNRRRFALKDELMWFDQSLYESEKLEMRSESSIYSMIVSNLRIIQNECLVFDKLVSNNQYFYNDEYGYQYYYGIYVNESEMCYFDAQKDGDSYMFLSLFYINETEDGLIYNYTMMTEKIIITNIMEENKYFFTCSNYSSGFFDLSDRECNDNYHMMAFKQFTSFDNEEYCNQLRESTISLFFDIISKMEVSDMTMSEQEELCALARENSTKVCNAVYYVSAAYTEEITGCDAINDFLDISFAYKYGKNVSKSRQLYHLYNDNRDDTIGTYSFFNPESTESFIEGKYIYENEIEYAKDQVLRCTTYTIDFDLMIEYLELAPAIDSIFNSADSEDLDNHDRLVSLFTFFARSYDEIKEADYSEVRQIISEITRCEEISEDEFNSYKLTINQCLDDLESKKIVE